MSASRLEDLRSHIEKLTLKGPLDISGDLHAFPPIVIAPKVTCKFFMQKCDADKVLEGEFREFLSEQIVRYVTKHKFLDPKRLMDTAYQTRLYRKARKRFTTKNPSAAEVGELILFVLLESQGILQVVQKMPLKTHKQMAIHGSDGVHVQVSDGIFLLHFGESKMVETYETGIKKAIESITEFYNDNDDDGEHDLEVELISTHIDEVKFEGFTDLIEELVLPYKGDKSKRREVNSIFIGYNWDTLCNLSLRGNKDLTSYLKEQYTALHPMIAKHCADAISKYTLKDNHFYIQFMPFIDEQRFRDKFKKGL